MKHSCVRETRRRRVRIPQHLHGNVHADLDSVGLGLERALVGEVVELGKR